MSADTHTLWKQYGAAVLATLLAALLRWLLNPLLHERAAFVTFFAAVIFAAWYGGLGPALAAIALSLLAAAVLFISPIGIPAATTPADWVSLGAFLFVGVACALLSEKMRLAREGAEFQREELHITLASIGDAVIATDSQGNVTFLNGVAESLTGWAVREAAGRPLADVFRIVNEQTRETVESPVEKVLREGGIVGLANHTVLIARDGTERPIDDSAAPIRDRSGTLRGVVLVFRDVCERKRQEAARQQAELEIRESEARKSAILETALDSIVTMDHQGRIVEFNPAAERMFGYRREAVIGQELARLLIPPALREQHHQGMARYLETGEGPVLGRRVELPALHADGGEFPVELAITRIPTAGPPLFTAYLRDITEARRAEQHRNVRLAVTQALNSAADAGQAAAGVLQAVCANLDWEAGFFWKLSDCDGHLTCLQHWSRTGTEVEGFVQASRGLAFDKGVGLPGRVWAGGEPGWILDIQRDDNFPRLQAAIRCGLHSAFACPVTAGGRFLGVIEFFTRRIREPEAELLELMGTAAGNFGQFIERKLAEDELRESEADLADFFENATIGLHWVGRDGIIVRANQAELDMLGYSREEYVGRPITDFHADQDVICDILNRLQAGEKLSEYPARLRCRDGSIRDVLIDSSVRWMDGQFGHTRCFTRDVTERKRAEQELQETRRRYHAVFNQQFQFMAILSPDGVVQEANETCFRATGVDRGQVLGRPLWATPWWEDLPAMQEQWRRQIAAAAEHGGPVAGEMEYSLADGTLRHATTVVTGLKNKTGEVTNIVVEGHDDTERQRNELLLAAQKRVLELLVQDAPLPDVLDSICEVIEGQSQSRLIATILLLDADGRHLHPVAGFRAPDAYSRAIDGAAIGPAVGSCGTSAYRGEQVIVSDIATDPLWADYRELALGHGLQACWSTPIFSNQGKVLGTFAVYYPTPREPAPEELRLVDILTRTAGIAIERRRDEQALRDADRRKDEFLATLAHELRNPLAPIRNGLHILRLAGADGETADEVLSMMERQLSQMVRLVDDLLDVSRITRGKLELRRQQLELATVIRNAVETSRPLVEAAGHTLTLTLPGRPVHVDADLTRLAQVFSNLLNNSAKYTEPGGQISLTAELAGNEAVIRVQDNGLGIPAESLPHIFQIFSQVDSHLERAQGGLGIGLTLVQRLVEMHGGTVAADSEGAGRGSTFTVRLPVLVEQPDQPAPAETALDKTTAKRRVLVVDDNRDSALSLRMMLKHMGHETRTAHDGLAAVKAAEEFRPDLILLDIGLPILNGHDACRRIREQPWSKRMVIVALTGWGQEEDRRRSAEAGFDHHMVKPVDNSALRQLLHEYNGGP